MNERYLRCRRHIHERRLRIGLRSARLTWKKGGNENENEQERARRPVPFTGFHHFLAAELLLQEIALGVWEREAELLRPARRTRRIVWHAP